MKKLKGVLAVILCLVLMQVPLGLLSQPITVQAAAKEGLYYNKANQKYYYYDKSGRKVTNEWKKVKSDWYYFGKNGAAYAAEKFRGITWNVERKKVGSKYYCFDSQGRRAQGLNATLNGTLYFCHTSTGVVMSTTTKTYRKMAKTRTDASALLKKLGKPVKKENIDSCFDLGGVGMVYTYKRYALEVFRYDATGKTVIAGMWPI